MNRISELFCLSFLHSFPAYEAVKIVHEEEQEADGNGHVRNIGKRCKRPEHDENYVVKRVHCGVIRASAEREIRGGKARAYRKCARNKVCRSEIAEYKVKDRGDTDAQNRKKHRINACELCNGDLGASFFVRIAYPRNKRDQSHRSCHSDVGDHLAVIREGVRNDSVKDTEYYHKYLTERMPLGAEDQGGDTDQGGDQGQEILTVKAGKGHEDHKERGEPKNQLPCGKIVASG